MTPEKTRALIAEDLRNSADMIRDRGNSVATIYAATIERLMRDAADALEALTVPDGDVRERMVQLIDKKLDGDCGYGVGEYLSDAILPAFPVLGRDIAGEIDAEREAEWVKVSDRGQAYRDGLRRAAEIVRNGR
ncbi:hypothetical protein MUN78_16455 [Leucobacter allii]|uniref:Uncharacterized protein n=1 Tax=Leucobacter allii TaxID=2932247 RepID=A0ABY4FLR6_9MICO|nr:hypothetical protein [Leucobacter allii]UOQ57222.1 hypothetical protein MUN78_16455 [Leucobacter allii]